MNDSLRPANRPPTGRPGRALSAAVVVTAILLGGCGKAYDVEGLVLKISADRRTLTVSHDPVPGFMDAMVMPFTASDGAVPADLAPGDRIGFRLKVRDDESRIDRVRILSAAATPLDSAGVDAAPALKVGDVVRSFTLTDQHGARVSLSDLRSRVVVVSFIYTRCPLPDYCPRVMTNLSAVRDRFGGRLPRELVLLTLTFDPTHDTPSAMADYAERYGANVPGWHMLTGPAKAIARVCAMFGVDFYPDEGMISHTLQTAVIDREGRLAALAEGRGFSAKQLGDLVEANLQ